MSYKMTSDEFDKILKLLHEEENEVCGQGRNEYASDSRPFRNFEDIAERLGISRESVLVVFLQKHIDGIASYARGLVSQREDVRGRIKDARLYLALLRGMIEEGE